MKEKFLETKLRDIKRRLNELHARGYDELHLYYYMIGQVSGSLETLKIIDLGLFLEIRYDDLAIPLSDYLKSLYSSEYHLDKNKGKEVK